MRWGGRIINLCLCTAVLLIVVGGTGLYLVYYGRSMDTWAYGSMGLWLSVYALVPIFALMILGLALRKIGKRRLKKKLLKHRCYVCVHCFYDLTARPISSHICPECGKYIPRRECVRLWCKLLRSKI